MITVNSLSGGRTSSFMAMHYPADVQVFACVCIDDYDARPKDPTVLQYCLDKLDGNFIASAESEKTLKVMMQLEQKLGQEIVWVRGKSFDEIIDGAGCLPTWARRFCTTELKILPIFEYIYFRHGIVKERIGYRYDESHRAYSNEREETVFELLDLFGTVQEAKEFIQKKYRKTKAIIKDYPFAQTVSESKNMKRRDITWADKEYPMIDDRITHVTVLRYWNQHLDFDFPPESNCAGCHHKSPGAIHRQWTEEPQLLEWFAKQEEKGKFNTWHDDRISYREKKEMAFTEILELVGGGSCETGYCTD